MCCVCYLWCGLGCGRHLYFSLSQYYKLLSTDTHYIYSIHSPTTQNSTHSSSSIPKPLLPLSLSLFCPAPWGSSSQMLLTLLLPFICFSVFVFVVVVAVVGVCDREVFQLPPLGFFWLWTHLLCSCLPLLITVVRLMPLAKAQLLIAFLVMLMLIESVGF